MDIYIVLKELEIKYKEEKHRPVQTIEEAKKLKIDIEGIGTKSLFLKNKKDYYLIILEEDERLDFKKIYETLKIKHLSFASSAELLKILNLKDCVTPFGIINDKNNIVTIMIEQKLQNKKLLFHPNESTKTLSIDYNDLIKFIEYENHKYVIF